MGAKISFVYLVTFLLLYLSSIANSSDWHKFRGNLANTGYTSEAILPPLSVDWQYSTAGPITSSPVVLNDILYIGARDSTIYALTASSGDLVWLCKTQGWIDCTPCVVVDKVYFTSRDGYFYALQSTDGSPEWRFRTQGIDCSSPVVVNNRVYFGSGYPNSLFYSLNAKTGRKVWEYEPSQMAYSSPAFSDGMVFIGANDGKFYAIDAESGELKWSFRTSGGIYFSSPAVFDSFVYCVPGNYDDTVYALYKETGAIKWTYPSSKFGEKTAVAHIPIVERQPHTVAKIAPQELSKPPPQVAKIQLQQLTSKKPEEPEAFIEIPASEIAFPVQDRTPIPYPALFQISEDVYNQMVFGSKSLTNVCVSSPAVDSLTVYVVSGGLSSQSLLAINRFTGALKWKKPIGSAPELGYSASPVVTDTIVWVGSGSGVLYAFRAATGETLWTYNAGSPIISSPAIANGRLYLATYSGNIISFTSSAKGAVMAGDLVSLPRSFRLEGNHPNPFTHSTIIAYQIPINKKNEKQVLHCELKVYNSAGQLVRTLVNEKQESGYYNILWDSKDDHGKEVGEGTYFYRLKIGEFQKTKKAIRVR